ncbi:Zinc transporter [Gnomoniopsis sp. IMI 355080]|nr:Zinc transporter [Gnomoniopsis sp. IMI 355080]
MEVAGVSNDTRGWIMCIVSGIACVAGALSFGVMIFSALFGMLPESKDYLKKDGWNEQKAGLIMMACFIGGFIGIQVISRLMHQIMPSHVVDCDHSHSHDHDETLDDPKLFDPQSLPGSRQHSRVGRPKLRTTSTGRRITTVVEPHTNGHTAHQHQHHHHHPHPHDHASESTPLLGSQANDRSYSEEPPSLRRPESSLSRRPSLLVMRDRLVSFVKDTPKHACDADGSCFGYSDPCGQECFKHVTHRASLARQSSLTGLARTRTSPFTPTAPVFEGPIPEVNSEDDSGTRSPISPAPVPSQATRTQSHDHDAHAHGHAHEHENHSHEHPHSHADHDDLSASDLEAQDTGAHHHHVPENAFLSIGFQTVIAIALHKFPEGFITYATNHANPKLGFNVFMALFVHNIAEGFAMALPLYMAIGSRLKAVAVSSLLGGFTQPLGATIGWLVIKWFGSGSGGGGEDLGIDFTAYAVLFAATAGIMASVALQLFVESLSLNHNRNLSMTFAFLGMVLLGVSNAIAGHSH